MHGHLQQLLLLWLQHATCLAMRAGLR